MNTGWGERNASSMALGATTRAADTSDDVLLAATAVSKRFGGVRAVEEVSIAVQRGAIAFEGRDITRARPAEIARRGIARTFQNIALFGGMTVLDNIMLGRHVRMKAGVLASFVYWGLAQREEVAHRARAEELIDFLELQDLRKQQTSALAYGLRKRVELARALALDPTLLLLDEPMGGMNQEEKEDMARYIIDVNEQWETTIILIEHDMAVVMDISDRVSVLDRGRKIAE